MSDIDYIKDKIAEEENDLKELKMIVNTLDLLLPENTNISVYKTLFDEIKIIHNKNNLREIRKLIKNIYPEWKDSISGIGYFDCSEYYYIRYASKIHKKIYFELRYSKLEDMPKSIFKNGTCKFEEVTETSKTFVCGVKK